MWYFYILECKDKSLYSGISNDLVRRVIKHNSGKGSKYTKFRRPVKLVYWEEFPDKISAAKREREVKDWKRTEKQRLIRSRFPSQEIITGESSG
ncbi:MAG TPA: GIY-YIG nuclease family protein [bacterium]|nr:GIY-YIG nuclease family protein [bacterium]